MQKLIISLICCLLPALAFGDQLTIRADAPDSYTVVKGDTLWDISGKFFKDPWRWPQIWGLNKEAIKNPHWIYPGDVIVLDRAHGVLHVEGAQPVAASGVAPTAPPPAAKTEAAKTEAAELKERALYGVRLSPHVEAGPGEHDAIPSIPYADIKPFLNQTLVIENGELDDSPEIVAGFEHQLLSNNDVAYVRNLPADKGTEWQVYHIGNPLIDPSSGETLGYEAVFLGNAHAEKFDKISTVRLYGSKEEITPGDRLVQSPGEFPENFIPRAPDEDITAQVIKIVNGITMAGPDSVVVINKGRRDGLQNGHVLALYHSGATVAAGEYGLEHTTRMPDTRYGLLFIFRTFAKVSYGLVMNARVPVEMQDVAETP